jgi:hypothetical protein
VAWGGGEMTWRLSDMSVGRWIFLLMEDARPRETAAG